MKRRLIILFSILIISFTACKDDSFDYGYVNFYINPESTEYFNLNYGNRGWEYFEGGMRGVVVFRINYGEFVCYERSCTAKDCHGRLDVDEVSNSLLICQKCNSSFLFIDGSPTNNSQAKRSLYSYCCYFDGTNLWVNNCN
jgi:nitrite reductase/ring-hydroxylating ferredoxin subunit